MKQKVYSILLVILMSMAANTAMAYDVEIDGIYYNFNGTEATVTSGNNQYVGDVVIPRTVNYNNTDYSVTNVGYGAFSYCYGLTSITIPNSVTSIDGFAFSGCRYLTSILIPNSVTSIGERAFAECKGLTSIVVDEGNTMYDSRYNCNAIIETLSNTLIAGCKNTTIPNNVTTIGKYAFSVCGLSSITIPNSVTTIGEEAFDRCNDLSSITIPNSVTSIGHSAFYACGLTSITIPSSVTSIGDNPFSNCRDLTAIVVEEGNTNYDSRNNCNAIIETSSNTLIAGCQNSLIPNDVTSIGVSAFYGCDGLTSITIPDGVTSIGVAAFWSSGLTSVTIPNSVTSIGDNAFLQCNGLTSITIPNSVTSIGYDAFYYCIGLTSITIPNSVTSIGSGALCGCSGLTSIVVEEGNPNYDSRNNCNAIIETSSNKLIAGCQKTTIPNNVTSIGEWAFRGCSGLTSITIPNNVKTIGYYAFGYCRELKDFYCKAKNIPTTDPYAFYETPINNIALHVPTVAINAYKTKSPWSDFKEIVGFDYLYVADLNIKPGESNTQEIGLKNEIANFVGFQMDLTLPDGIGIDKTGCTLSSRITDENQQLIIGKLESGAYRIASTSLSLTPISGNDGTLLSLTLTAEDGCIGGQATISNIIFSTAESEKVVMSDKTFDINILKKYNLIYIVDGEEYWTEEVTETTPLTLIDEPTKDGYTFGGWSDIPETMPNHDVEITGNFYLFGDVNTDEEVDVVDVVDIARFVVAIPSANFREKLADLNFDNTVNIADAVTLVNHIAGDQNFARAMESYNYDQCLLQLVNNGANTLSLCLDGNADFTAFQFEVELPENTDITAMRINGQRKDNHKLLYTKVGDNHYRVAVVSLSNAIFKGNEGELLNISIEGQPSSEINIHDILFVTKNGTSITFDDITLSEAVTGIANIDANESKIVIYDLQGRKLSRPQRGVNIVNGKKVVVK